MITKKCQIRATTPITCFSVPIIGNTKLNLTSEEIYKCLCAKAEVLEILENGKTINLDFTNYNRDNSIIGEPIVTEKTSDTVTEELQEVVDTPVDITENNLSIVGETDEVIVGDTISTEHEDEAEVIISTSENTTTDYESETTSTSSEAYIVKDHKYENKKNKNKKK